MTEAMIAKAMDDVAKMTEAWRDVLDAYQSLKDTHETFRMTAVDANQDFAGPGLQEALARLFHKRKFSIFLEDLLFEDHRKGGVSQLVPPESSAEEKKDKSKKQNKPKFS